VDSSNSSLPQRIGPLDLNEALFCTGLGPRELCHEEMRRVGAYPIQVKLPCPLGHLSQWGLFVAEDMAIAELLVDQEELLSKLILFPQNNILIGLHFMACIFVFLSPRSILLFAKI
jgi:hypothetical protein